VTLADYDDGFAGPAPVDAHPREGFVQLGGNVSEWVEDRHQGAHVLKGGSFGVAHAAKLESAHFEHYVDGTRSMHFGVRCAK